MTQGFQMMIESGLGDRIQEVAARFNEEMTRIAETAGATLESSSERIVTSMSTAGNDFANSVDQLLDRFRETLDQGQELLQLQDTLQNNMERLEQVHHLDQTFSDMRASLHALHPVLARLQDPVPVRLILDGVDLPDAGEDGLAVHAGGNGAGNGNGERTGDAAAGETDKPVGS
jgi:hypothetical protein